MAVIEITDKARVASLLARGPLQHLEAIDENALGVDGIVSVFCEDVEDPGNILVVRWAQSALGLRSVAHLDATRLSGLEDVVSALPAERAQYDAVFPFWASPAFGACFNSQVSGARAVYTVSQSNLQDSNVVRQCTRVDDLHPVKAMFRKLAEDAPAYALTLKGQLASVAVVTHLRDGVARLSAYTVEEFRKRGFGRGVITALADELLAMDIKVSISIDLADEPSVRMVERAGFRQAHTLLAARLAPPNTGGLVQIGR